MKIKTDSVKEVLGNDFIDNADDSICISNSQHLTNRHTVLQNIIHHVILSTLMSNQSFFHFLMLGLTN